MAADLAGELERAKALCSNLEKKVSKLQEGRSCLKKGIDILEGQVEMLRRENGDLKKECEEERVRAESERDAKERELSIIMELNKEICNLKAEISVLQETCHSRVQNDDGDQLQVPQVFEGEAEINRLTELLEKERDIADMERKKARAAQNEAQAEKKKATEAKKQLKAEKGRRKEEKRRADLEKKHAEEYKLCMEKSKAEIDEVRMEIVSERTKAEEANRCAKAEKQKADREKRHADQERNRVEEYRHCMEASKAEMNKVRVELISERTKAEEANRRAEVQNQKADREKQRADAEMAKVEEQRKSVDAEKRKRMEEKSRADHLSQQLEDEKQKKEALEKEIRESKHSNSQCFESERYLLDDNGKNRTMKEKILKQQLKLEKLRVKHAKRKAEEERTRKHLLQQELYLLKQDVLQFTRRLNLIEGCFSFGLEGIDGSAKAGGSTGQPVKSKLSDKSKFDLYCQSENDLGKTDNSVLDGLNCCGPMVEQTGPFLPISGITSELEPLVGGSIRKKLQNFGICSTTTSFSDRKLVDSQGRGGFSSTKSTDLVEANSKQDSVIEKLSGESDDRGSFNSEKHARLPRKPFCSRLTPILDNRTKTSDKMSGRNKKRKSSQEVLEEIAHLFTEEKLHLKIDEKRSSLDDILSLKYNMPMPLSSLSDRNSEPLGRERKIAREQEIVCQAQPCDQDEEGEQRGNLNVEGSGDQVTRACFEDISGVDCMKLLELDNDADEERYRRAIRSPLSPTLPEIDFSNRGVSEAEDSIYLVKKCIYRGLAMENNNLRPSVSSINEMEIEPNELGFAISEETAGIRINISNEELKHCHVPYSLVVFPDIKDEDKISRIYCSMKLCVSLNSLVSLGDWVVVEVLRALAPQKDLLPKEKACAFFSALLYNLSIVDLVNSRSSAKGIPLVCSDSFLAQLEKVIFKAETCHLFLEVCQLEVLFSLIENFLIYGRVLVFRDVPHEQLVGKTLVLEGKTISVASETATVDQLVAGSSILASFCAALDHVGFLREASFNILRMCKYDGILILTVLHVFASTCGKKYFVPDNCDLLVITVRSIVSFLERGDTLMDAGPKFPSCAECPFGNDAVCMDKVTLLLLEKLQDCAVQRNRHQSPRKSVASLGCIADDTFGHLNDIVSLVELVAYYMGWDWSYNRIIPHLWEMLESSLFEEFSVAILILVGQLGRLGIDADGYEHKGVEDLRCNLSAFLDLHTKREVEFPTQVATVNALIILLGLEFGEVVESDRGLLGRPRRLNHLKSIRKWFSQLTKEQEYLSLNLLRSGI